MILSLVTEPSIEPVSLETAKAHSRIDGDDSDQEVNRLIKEARMEVERFTGRALINQTWDYYITSFPLGDKEIVMPKAPLSSVTSITYVDTAGANQTLSSTVYTADADSDPGQIYLAYGQAWPSIRDQRKAVKIRYVAGYGTAETDIPEPLVQAVLLLVGHRIENKEIINIGTSVTPIPFTIESLLIPYRVNYL